jgi:hypothetical protein
MYEAYARRLASLPQRTPERLNVLLFADRNEYLRTLRVQYGVDGRGTGGLFFVTPLGSALAVWVEDLPRRRVLHVLQHEGFHQFAYSRFGDDLPIWLNEGLAEFFGSAVLVGRTLVIGQTNPRVLQGIKQAIELDRTIPFRRMLSISPDDWMRGLREGSAPLQYNQAWSMVQFLVYGDGGRYVKAFDGYLRLVNAAVPSEVAFARSFGPDVQAFERRWKTFTLNSSPSAFIAAMERIEFLAEGALELSRQGIVPASLAELRRQLEGIGFRHTLARHGLDLELQADDPELYQIPRDDLADEQPVFVVEPVNPARLPARLRRFEQEHPAPPLIRTEHLEPHGLELTWRRDLDGGRVAGYEIEVR